MISYLIDTHWIIYFLKGKKEVVDKLVSILDRELAISIVSLAELYEGVYASLNPEEQMKGLLNFLAGVTILGIDEKVAEIFGKQRAKLRKEGSLIDNFDLLIAATAIYNDLTLLTSNASHFDRIEGLKIWM